jgi:hypothetical protein
MATKQINYTLPEFVFLDGQSHLGDTLEDRTVVLHVMSATLFEIIHMNNILISEFKARSWDIQFINPLIAGIEDIKVLLHYTSVEDEQLEKIVAKLKNWYFDYLLWEDKNILG